MTQPSLPAGDAFFQRIQNLQNMLAWAGTQGKGLATVSQYSDEIPGSTSSTTPVLLGGQPYLQNVPVGITGDALVQIGGVLYVDNASNGAQATLYIDGVESQMGLTMTSGSGTSVMYASLGQTAKLSSLSGFYEAPTHSFIFGFNSQIAGDTASFYYMFIAVTPI